MHVQKSGDGHAACSTTAVADYLVTAVKQNWQSTSLLDGHQQGTEVTGLLRGVEEAFRSSALERDASWAEKALG